MIEEMLKIERRNRIKSERMKGKIEKIIGIEMFKKKWRRRKKDGEKYRGWILREGKGVENNVERKGGEGLGEDVMIGVDNVRNENVNWRWFR